MNLDDIISIKDEPELRHALAHMYYAIEALSKGNKREALYELKSIESLIFWEDDEHMTAYVESNNGKMHSKEEKELQGKEELQGQDQEILQGKEEITQPGKDAPFYMPIL